MIENLIHIQLSEHEDLSYSFNRSAYKWRYLINIILHNGTNLRVCIKLPPMTSIDVGQRRTVGEIR